MSPAVSAGTPSEHPRYPNRHISIGVSSPVQFSWTVHPPTGSLSSVLSSSRNGGGERERERGAPWRERVRGAPWRERGGGEGGTVEREGEGGTVEREGEGGTVGCG